MDRIDLPDDWDVVSVDLNKLGSEGICSASEGDASTSQEVTMQLTEPTYELNLMVQNSQDCSWMKKARITNKQEDRLH